MLVFTGNVTKATSKSEICIVIEIEKIIELNYWKRFQF